MDNTSANHENPSMVEMPQEIHMMEIRWSDGQRFRFYEDEIDTAIFFQLEPFERVTHVLHAATILIVSLLLRKTNIIWEDGGYARYGLEIRCYGNWGQLILGPNPWEVVHWKILAALCMIFGALIGIFRMIYSLDTRFMIMIIMIYDALQIYSYFFN